MQSASRANGEVDAIEDVIADPAADVSGSSLNELRGRLRRIQEVLNAPSRSRMPRHAPVGLGALDAIHDPEDLLTLNLNGMPGDSQDKGGGARLPRPRRAYHRM